jgi:hypothetical protein
MDDGYRNSYRWRAYIDEIIFRKADHEKLSHFGRRRFWQGSL